MKIIKYIFSLCFLAVLVACSEDAFVPQQEVITAGDDSVDLISMVVPDVEIDATTRSKLYEDGDELKFTWQENDAIGVIPLSGNPLRFPIHAENAGKNTAVFDGGDWALKTSTKYAAFFPYNRNISDKDISSIAIDYTGQTQSNWMKYDFMGTGAVQPKDGAVKFTMQRLSAILKIRIYIPSNNNVRYGTLIAPTPAFGVKGTLDLSGSEPVYTPEGLTKFINTDIGVDKSTSSSGTPFIFYIMIPPTDLSGKTLTFRVNSDSGTAQEANFTGSNYEAGKAYYINASVAGDPLIKNMNLIAAAEASSGITFDRTAVGNYVNANSQREKILQVKELNVSKLDDPTVCDEIGFFRNLEKLVCYKNQLTYLDVSNNPNLNYLGCSSNQLTSLDLSNNKALKTLYCGDNQLNSLDLSNNNALTDLSCTYNDLGTLDISSNIALTSVDCDSTKLVSLDISNNPALKVLWCRYNRLTSLDVSKNVELKIIECDYNRLTSLDVSNNTALTYFNCCYNQLTSLDLSNNMALNFVSCEGNHLDSLIVTDHPSLERLYVGNRGFKKLDCHGNALTTLSIYDCYNSLTYLNCSDNALESLSSVRYYSALKSLECKNNQLTSLIVPTSLTYLFCSFNLMSSLDITKCKDMTKSNVLCGAQFTNSDKTDRQTLTLYARSEDTSPLYYLGYQNSYVTVVNQ